MVFLGGPRQVGKTTLALNLLGESKKSNYLNWDYDLDREKILKRELPKKSGLVVLDEIHKYREWRSLVKGYYDKFKPDLNFLITGSAKLDYYRHGGDSLQGRYYYHRLHPLSVAELNIETYEDLEQLIMLSGFPEPFYSGKLSEKKRWSAQYRSLLIKQDLNDLEAVQNIQKIELLALHLPKTVSSLLSINSFARDLGVSFNAVKSWLAILERLYYHFRIYPYGPPHIKALKKSAKCYLFDWSLVEDSGPRLENLVALHLLKWCHHEQDTGGRDLELRYFQNDKKKEVDFIILEDKKPILFLEVKSSIKRPAEGIRYLKKIMPEVRSIIIAPDQSEHLQDNFGIEKQGLLEFLQTLH